MANLEQLIPDVEVLLALAPEDLAPYLFEVAKGQLQNGMFAPGNLVLSSAQLNPAAYRNSPWDGRTKEIELATAEAWNWLRVQGLVVPASGINGQHGFLVISRRGQSIKSAGDFHRFKDAAAFPKSLLHPAIAGKVWLDVVRNDLADAVFTAFRAVEEAVRAAGGYSTSDIGVDLMRKAFDPKGGPLADMSQEKGEREALAHMFAGAIGSYKKPHSHRTVSLTDTREAQEMVMHASHLLRIVEDRSAKRKARK